MPLWTKRAELQFFVNNPLIRQSLSIAQITLMDFNAALGERRMAMQNILNLRLYLGR